MYPHYDVHHHHPRNLADLGSSSHRTLLIIICVVAAVGGFIIAIVFIRIFRIIFRLDRYRPSPLPPVQPLAHHREQQLALFVERNGSESTPATWHGSYLTIPMSDSMAKAGSEISLLHRDPSVSCAPSPGVSLGFSESSDATDETTVLSSAKPLEFPPQRSFPDHPSLEGAESQSMPTTLRSHTSQSTSSTHLTTARPRPQSSSRPRPVSMSSVSSTALTPRNSRAIRGLPHGPHSRVQVILPAPLAPSLHAHMAGEDPNRKRHSIAVAGFTSDHSRRLSVVDQWAQIPIRSASRERRSSSINEPRASMSSIASSGHSHPRSSSEPPLATALRSPTPPVPRIPSIYNTYTPDQIEHQSSSEPEPVERGRRRSRTKQQRRQK